MEYVRIWKSKVVDAELIVENQTSNSSGLNLSFYFVLFVMVLNMSCSKFLSICTKLLCIQAMKDQLEVHRPLNYQRLWTNS